ncbi:MAG: 4'-phosphopantetheinyl transferase superfamily protein [Lautropia sp.]|nr:4'-phosphopantetheinyl transferase superfamily protein [Lautropia sp.]
MSAFCRVPAPVLDQYSLSHSQGHAVLASANFPTKLGVDLEAVRLRDYRRMLPFFVSPDEDEWWQQQPDPGLAFYRLWTIKEALLKAQGLSFPADLPKVGLRRDDDCASGLRLEAPGSCRWQGTSAVLDGRWLLSCVWAVEAELPDPLIECRFVGLPLWHVTDECCFGVRHPMISASAGTPGTC